MDAPLSSIAEGDSDSVTVGASSSVMVKVTAAGVLTPWLFCTVADTVTIFGGALTRLSAAVIVTVPALVVCPAAMVSVFALDSEKSLDTAGDTSTADTVIVVAAVEVRFNVAVTVVRLVAPLSPIVDGVSTSVTCRVASSLSMVRIKSSGGVTAPTSEATVPDTITRLSKLWSSSSTAVIVTVPALCPRSVAISPMPMARKVRVALVLTVKSFAVAGATAVADIVTTSVPVWGDTRSSLLPTKSFLTAVTVV